MNIHTLRSVVGGAVVFGTAITSASAQVKLVAGWNFGQFISAGIVATDGSSGAPVTSIPSNFAGSTRPAVEDSGVFHAGNGIDTVFSAGTGVLAFNSSVNAASSNWLNDDISLIPGRVVVTEVGAISSINGQLVNGLDIYIGDDNNANLRFVADGSSVRDFTISLSTVGFGDYDAASFSQGLDDNLTFAAYKGSGASASIEWFFNGTSYGTTSTSSGAFAAFSVDLPASFYGQSNAVLVGRVTGDIVIDNVQINAVTASAIPESSTFAAVAGVAVLGLAALRRRRSV